MKTGIVLLALLFCPFVASSDNRDASTEIQQLVDQIVARHPQVVRLTVHAVPAGATKSRIIASNISDKIGDPSDPEDLHAMATKEIVVLWEGSNVDITMAILDKAGQAVAAAGITLEADGVTNEAELVMEAQVIAEELTSKIREAERLP